jgi:hypothetical protein
MLKKLFPVEFQQSFALIFSVGVGGGGSKGKLLGLLTLTNVITSSTQQQ